MNLQNLALQLFLALGGVALILKFVPTLVDQLANLIFKSPAAKAFIAAHAEDLKAALRAAEQEAEKEIDSAKE